MKDLAKEERLAFSTRLKLAMEHAQLPVKPSVLAREFNRRAHGMEVTSHGARKWLVGEAIPTQQRLLVLARWLDVQLAWLRFGAREGVQPAAAVQAKTASDGQLHLMRDIAALSAQAQALVRELVDSLHKLEAALGRHRNRTNNR
jgi:hypothetical protein